jgi:predicted nucleic acid-binding protein
MTTVFLDTVGLLALWDSSDQWHGVATAALDRLGSATRLATSSFVLLECGNAAARRPYRHLVDRLRTELEAGGKLIVPTEADWNMAWSAYASSGVGGPGIVDHVSFVLMRRLGIREVLSNDRHFRAAGFDTLF